MKGKLMLLAGFGAGYVFGTKAGRSKYEEIRSKAQKVWQDPRVAERKEQAMTMAKEQGEHLRETALHAVKEKMPQGSEGSTGSGDLSQASDVDLGPSGKTVAGKEPGAGSAI